MSTYLVAMWHKMYLFKVERSIGLSRRVIQVMNSLNRVLDRDRDKGVCVLSARVYEVRCRPLAINIIRTLFLWGSVDMGSTNSSAFSRFRR